MVFPENTEPLPLFFRLYVHFSLTADLLLSDFGRFVPEAVPCPSLLAELPPTTLDRWANSRQDDSP